MAFKFVKKMSKPVLFMLGAMTIAFAADIESQFPMDDDFAIELKEIACPNEFPSKNKEASPYELSVSAPEGVRRETKPIPTPKPRYQYLSDSEDTETEGSDGEESDFIVGSYHKPKFSILKDKEKFAELCRSQESVLLSPNKVLINNKG